MNALRLKISLLLIMGLSACASAPQATQPAPHSQPESRMAESETSTEVGAEARTTEEQARDDERAAAVQQIMFRNDVPPGAEYEYLGEISCNIVSRTRAYRLSDSDFPTNRLQQHIQQCRAELREDAYEKYGDFIVVSHDISDWVNDTAYVILFAEVYRRVELQEPREADSSTLPIEESQ